MKAKAIEVKDLWVCYRLTKSISLKKILKRDREKIRTFCAIKGVSFSVPKGEIVGIIGKNGSGKINTFENNCKNFFS